MVSSDTHVMTVKKYIISQVKILYIIKWDFWEFYIYYSTQAKIHIPKEFEKFCKVYGKI